MTPTLSELVDRLHNMAEKVDPSWLGAGLAALLNEAADALRAQLRSRPGVDVPRLNANLRDFIEDLEQRRFFIEDFDPVLIARLRRAFAGPGVDAEPLKCEDCDGTGEQGDLMYMGDFQPPERERCSSCGGSGYSHPPIPAQVKCPVCGSSDTQPHKYRLCFGCDTEFADADDLAFNKRRSPQTAPPTQGAAPIRPPEWWTEKAKLEEGVSVTAGRPELMNKDVLIEQLCKDLNQAHDELMKAQGCTEPSKYDWPEWSPQANSIRAAETLLGKRLAKTTLWTMFPAPPAQPAEPSEVELPNPSPCRLTRPPSAQKEK